METQEVPGSPDQVDLTINVAEKPTGTLQLGAGFSSAEKVSLTFGIAQENVFGSGNYLGLQVNTSKYNRTLSLTTTDPYFTQGRHLAHASASTTRPRGRTTASTATTSWSTKAPASASACRSAKSTRSSSASASSATSFDPGGNVAFLTPQSYRNYFGCATSASGLVTGCTNDTVWGVPLTVGWSRDDRDSALVPTRGRLQRANLEVGVGGDMQVPARPTTSTSSSSRSTSSTPWRSTARSATARRIGGKPFPIFKNFYAGGLGSVRGFEQNSLGPRDVPCWADRRRGAGRHQEGDLQRRAEHAVPRRRQRPHAAPLRLLRRRQRVRHARRLLDRRPVEGGKEAPRLGRAWASAGSRRWARCAWPTPSRSGSRMKT